MCIRDITAYELKKVGKWITLCCISSYEWVTAMNKLNLNQMIYYFIENDLMSRNGLSTYFFFFFLI